METGKVMPAAPVCPGPVRTPTLQGRNPKLLQPRREAEAQATCLTVHLSASTPAGSPVLFSSLFFLSNVLRDCCDKMRRFHWLFSVLNLLSLFWSPSLIFSSCAGCPHWKSVPVISSTSSSLHLFILFTASFPGVNSAVTSFPSFLSSLSPCPLLSHCPSPPKHSHSFSLPFSLSLFLSLSHSHTLSL